ncbi:MAG: transporter substrate-binding domain-containing protein, partial [Candidatus Ventricola sp.]
MKKLIALALAFAMILTCSFALADRLADIQAAGKIVIATSPDWPPYEYIDDDGNIVGTDVLMMQWIAEQLGVELEIQPLAFDACLAAVGRGDVDLMVAGLTFDEERLNAMELTGIYWNEGDQGLLVKKGMGATYNSAEAFNGKTVAAQNGTNQQIMVEEQLTGATLELVTKIPDGVNMVKTGRVDALAVPKTV